MGVSFDRKTHKDFDLFPLLYVNIQRIHLSQLTYSFLGKTTIVFISNKFCILSGLMEFCRITLNIRNHEHTDKPYICKTHNDELTTSKSPLEVP